MTNLQISRPIPLQVISQAGQAGYIDKVRPLFAKNLRVSRIRSSDLFCRELAR